MDKFDWVFSGDLTNTHSGDIIVHNGRNYKVTKKTTTSIAIERYYWWDRWYDKWFKGNA